MREQGSTLGKGKPDGMGGGTLYEKEAGSETAAIARGVAAELGNLKDTQGKPEVGPYAPKK